MAESGQKLGFGTSRHLGLLQGILQLCVTFETFELPLDTLRDVDYSSHQDILFGVFPLKIPNHVDPRLLAVRLVHPEDGDMIVTLLHFPDTFLESTLVGFGIVRCEQARFQ